MQLLLLFLASAFATVVKLEPDVDPGSVMPGVEYRRVRGVDDVYIYASSNSHYRSVSHMDGVIWSAPNEKRERVKKQFNDPLYEDQWHLRVVKAQSAWEAHGVTGRNVNIAIVDDGVQWDHPDLHNAYRGDLSTNVVEFHSTDTTPSGYYDAHGTAAAGVCCAAANNRVCGVGVAHGASLVAIKLLDGPISDVDEAEALSHKRDEIDIYSCSWGPADTGKHMAAPGRVLMEALHNGVERGRNGKGSIFVWAGGNGHDNSDSCNYDGYASSRFTLAIGAVAHDHIKSWYSEACPGLLAVAPSSGARRGITTIDLPGNAGYNAGQCTDGFGGTSASAPLAAGVIALLLEKRPDLTWRDVQHMIAKTSERFEEISNTWQGPNARGYSHSHWYGFGLLRADRLLEAAESWQLVPSAQLRENVVRWVGYEQIAPEWTEIRLGKISSLVFIEAVEVVIYLSHAEHGRGYIDIELVSPSGTVSTLSRPHADRSTAYPWGGWKFTSLAHWGEMSDLNHDWKLRFKSSLATRNNGFMQSIKLDAYGY